MNTKIILRTLGGLILFVTLSSVFSLAWSLFLHENEMIRAFYWTLFIGSASGILLMILGRGAAPTFYLQEGIAVVSCGWVACAVIAALPFYLSGYMPSFIDAFFEAMSGLTTTGATVLSGLDSLPKGFLFWRSFIQWVGGMGIIVLFVAVLPALGVSGRFLYRLEVPGVSKEGLKPQIQEAASVLWKIYIGLSLVQAVLLWFAGMTIFDSLCHTFTTMATGGFSTHDDSIGFFQSAWIETIIMVFMFLAGVNFTLHFYFLKGPRRRVFQDVELKWYAAIVVVAALISTLVLSVQYDWLYSLRLASFQVISIMTTTGYATADFAIWPGAIQLILIGLMFCGACAGSTGGGMKVFRVVVSLKSLHLGVHQFIRPRIVRSIRLGKQAITEDVHVSILGFFMTFISIFFICSLIMTWMGLDIVTATSAVIASLGNVGPGLGQVGPAYSWGFLPAGGKLLLAICMMLGRLELYTALAIFVPSFWKRG